MSEANSGRRLPEYRSAHSGYKPNPNPSILHCFINQPFQFRLDALALRRGLLHQDDEQVLLAVDDEIAAGGAVPFQLTKRTRRRRFCNAGIGAHRKPEAVTETVAREIEIIPRNTGTGSD